MCGISGVVASECDPLTEADVRSAIKMWTVAESRGGDAVGSTTDTNLFWYPGKLRYAKLTNAYKRFTKTLVDSACVLNHNRLATRGSPKFRGNNHPIFKSGRIATIHNGWFSSAKYDLTPLSTDTTIIVHAVEDFISADVDLWTAFSNAVKHVRGGYAVAIIDYTESKLLLAKGPTYPLCVSIADNRIKFASTPEILDIPPGDNYFDLKSGIGIVVDLVTGTYEWKKFTVPVDYVYKFKPKGFKIKSKHVVYDVSADDYTSYYNQRVSALDWRNFL